MHEILVIVPKRNSGLKKVLNIVWFVLTCAMIILAMMVPVLFILAILFGVLWYFQTFQSETEYEYTYFDGDLRMARIRAKRRRKQMAEIEMDNVITIAPRGDRSVYKYENDKSVPCKNLTSGNPDARVYEVICKSEKGFARYEFEPDDEMLDAIMVKYPRAVVRQIADGFAE